MGLVRREIPFGSDARSGRRSLYRIDDPFLRLWFRVVAPHRSALAVSPPETRLRYWHRHCPALESHAWEELSRMSVPWLHRCQGPLAALGPFEQARRFWRGSSPELDIVSRSVDGKRLLVGESKLSGAPGVVIEGLRPGHRGCASGGAGPSGGQGTIHAVRDQCRATGRIRRGS